MPATGGQAVDGGRGQPLLERRVLAQRRGQGNEAVFLDDVLVHPHGWNGDGCHQEPDKDGDGRDKSAQGIPRRSMASLPS